ncbi:MAG: 4Fe-4S binding protein [Nitrospiraceae bacterium]|nr:4Fe-4S binding protein [Nitrospiraceae bacterium]
MKGLKRFVSVLAVLVVFSCDGEAQFRFPMPEFESDYRQPEMYTPPPGRTNDLMDVAVLAGALGVGAWLVLKRRSRPGVFLLTVFSLIYFGFWRQGCVCPIGSMQNVAEGILDANVVVPMAIVAFFLLPLLFALFFGRVFCAGVCPLGALQELVAVRPVALPQAADRVLGLIPYLYLGVTVLSVSTGAGFLICRYDPFVGFFRQGASFNLLMAGGILLLLGLYIGRPYCRYLCPYGVLLGWMSRFAKWHARITPTECIQCRLCEDACPYGAINTPAPEEAPISPREGTRRLGKTLFLAPVIVALGALTGMMAHDVLARLHPTIQLAERVAAEERGYFSDVTLESEAFRASRTTLAELYAAAHAVRADFKRKSPWLGAFLGLVVAWKLVALSIKRKRVDYEVDRVACVSCARCFPYCPVEDEDAKTQKHKA